MNRPLTFLAIGLLLVLSASLCLADEKEELKDILGGGSEQKPEGQASTPVPSSNSNAANSNAANNNNSNTQKKLNIVVSSINDDGVKEEAGHVGPEVSVEQEQPPVLVEDKSLPKNNHVRFVSPLSL